MNNNNNAKCIHGEKVIARFSSRKSPIGRYYNLQSGALNNNFDLLIFY